MPHTSRPYVLAETNYKDTLSADFGVAVLPWGATLTSSKKNYIPVVPSLKKK